MDSFFGIGFPELVTILILAGIIMGPERMGRVARWLGKTTAQLQAISRGFMRQLTTELEAVDDTGELKNAMEDIQDLQRQLRELRGEVRGQTTDAMREGEEAFRDIERSIQPPTLQAPKQDGQTGDEATNNGSAPPPQTPTELPNVIEVPDDPET